MAGLRADNHYSVDVVGIGRRKCKSGSITNQVPKMHAGRGWETILPILQVMAYATHILTLY